ncbi:MAG: polysaccharide export protein [Thermoguttaceae bacterium]|nr:polysaccharide export protein [Thermoguttaceae bacterium]MDW8079823.1 polysaccharide biosynthesis/export family protein [Thermoguttaceae bacterium]
MRVLKSPLFVAVALVMAMSGSGCARRVYRAHSLPASVQAPPRSGTYQQAVSQLVRAVPPSDAIQPGDLLEILVAPHSSPSEFKPIPLRVSEEGAVFVPLVGQVEVAGLRPEEAEAVIAQLARDRGVYVNPVVSVTVKKPRTNRVTVVGAVRKEGVYELPVAQSTLLDALVAAGNLSEDADLRIEIHRAQRSPTGGPRIGSGEKAVEGPNVVGASWSGNKDTGSAGPETVVVDLAQPGKILAEDYQLGDGDVVIVPKRPPQSVYVLGLVNRPGKIDIPPNQDLFLLDALAMAGGRTSELADRVAILRQHSPDGGPIQILASVRQAKRDPRANIRLAPGDVVSVEETPITMVERMMRYFLRIGVSASVPVL